MSRKPKQTKSVPALSDAEQRKLFDDYIDRISPILVELRQVIRSYDRKLNIITTPEGYFDFEITKRSRRS